MDREEQEKEVKQLAQESQETDTETNPWNQVPELETFANKLDHSSSRHRRHSNSSYGDFRGTIPLRQHADEAFSSSSDDDDNVAPLRRHHMRRLPPASSEFDKALLSGVASIGAASFDGSEFALSADGSSHAESTPSHAHKSYRPDTNNHATGGSSLYKRTKGPNNNPININNNNNNMSTGTATPNLTTDDTHTNTKTNSLPPSDHDEQSANTHYISSMHKSPSASQGRSIHPPEQSATARPPSHQPHHPVSAPPVAPLAHNPSMTSHETISATRLAIQDDDLSHGVLPDVLMSMRQKIESLTLFDSEMIKLAEGGEQWQRDSLKRSSQQSLSAAVLVSLAHKRYERRRLAAMEIEKVVRGLAQQQEMDRIRAILLLLSDDYVRSTSEDARKGGVVALAACGIGLKKSPMSPKVSECRDLILASVVHACQDHSQRVRYYATESLFNVVKINPTLAVQHFFILFEILRSLYADVDADVRSGAELLDKKLKEVIVGAINSGTFSADACVPIFGRFVHMRNKATQRLTLTWLQELNEKLLGNPVLEFLHLFLGGIFTMIADPNIHIRQSALAFLQSVLPKLLMTENETFDDKAASMKMDFDKLIQSLVTTLEHPDPFVRKVAMYWMSRIVKTYIGGDVNTTSAASMSVRNSVPHVLPGILLSIGDTFHTRASSKDSFLPDQTTHSLAQQTNACLQESVMRDGKAYATHLDGFLVALREELDSPGKDTNAAVERKQYRMDIVNDGSGIESTGWFRASKDTPKVYEEDATSKSRLCALEWVVVLYESVVPDILKAEFAREFVSPIIHQLVGNPPELIVRKSLEVLAKITVPVPGETRRLSSLNDIALSSLLSYDSSKASDNVAETAELAAESPMTNADAVYALEILTTNQGMCKSRDRSVFSALIQLHAHNHQLLIDLPRAIQIMCSLQPPEFVFVSFAVEIDAFVRQSMRRLDAPDVEEKKDDIISSRQSFSTDLNFVSSFIQKMSHVLLVAEETNDLRELLRDCVGKPMNTERDKRRIKLFHILLHSFGHNLMASTSLCLWAGAYRTATFVLQNIDPLDIHLMFLLDVDHLVELLERPLFRHFHLRMLEADNDPHAEGSGALLFRTLALILMIVPQSTCYRILRDRLVTVSRFRQSALAVSNGNKSVEAQRGGPTDHRDDDDTWMFASCVLKVRMLHCDVAWESIRSESLESPWIGNDDHLHDEGSHRRAWLGYATKEEEEARKLQLLVETTRVVEIGTRDGNHNYDQIEDMTKGSVTEFVVPEDKAAEESAAPSEQPNSNSNPPNQTEWKAYWVENAS